MEANPKILCISELLKQSLPLTGTSSLNPSHPLHSHTKPNNDSPQQHSTNPLYNSSILSSVNHPTLIIGTLSLPIHAKCPSSNSTYSACFSLSDGSAFLCCDLIDLENIPNVIGKKIHVLSWNFIPFKKCGGGGGGGFLEIIRWCLPPASPFSLAPCSKEGSVTNNVYRILGRLKSVSPVSTVPCTFQDRNSQITSTSTNMSGFLAELLICKCKLCNSKNSVMGLNCWLRWKDGHCFSEGVKVYFFGDALSWHPMVSKLIGKAVCLTGLKKKLVYIGKEDSRLMFTTTDKATFHMILLPTEELSPFKRSVIRGKGESGAYSGIVTGVYMQGMVVELDEKVCLLLTDQLLAPPHFVRVGALISLRNVHFVQTNFSWARVLLLGACFKTSINIKSFSPLESQCHIRSQSQSFLGKFTASLVFSARFWFLLTISSFKRKFAGFYSEREILGSKHKEGLVQMYAKSCLPSCVFRPRNGVLMEFCNHDLCGCRDDERNDSCLKLAVPISTFINHCEVLWLAMLAKMQTDYKISGKSNHFSCEGKSYRRSNRRIVSSGDLGLVLLGTLQISSSSGRLQLVDSSGSIDVVIPDISSNYEASNVYEVRYYNIIIEGVPAEVDASCLPTSESFSFRNIFHHVLPNKEIKPSAIYVHFYMRDATCLNFGLRLPYMDGSYNLMRTEDGMFHLLLVAHKFPAKENFQGDSVVSNKSSFFVEAMILPWSLLLSGDHRDILINGFSRESLREHLQIAHRQNLIANSCRKKLKLAHGSNGVLFSALEDNIGEVGSVARAHNNLSAPHKLPCLVLVRNFSSQKQARQGVLLHNEHGAIDGVVSKPSDKYFLLEFKSEIFKNYELLQVGGLYVMEYAKEELSQNIKNHHYATARKRLVTSQTPLWSISLSSDEVISPSELVEDDLLKTTSIRNGMVPCECSPAGGLFFQQCIRQIPETCSHDVNLHLSVDAMNLLKLALKPLEEKLIKPPCLLRVTPDPHTCARTMMNASAHSFNTANHSGTLPQGNLISLHGNVVDVHNFSCYSDIKTHVSHGGIGDMHQTGLYKGRPSNICIHLSKDNDIVKLRGSLSKHGCPLGMGPSAVATFHRVLVKGQHEFMLAPTSFIVVDSIKEVPDNDESLVLTELDSMIPNDLETVASSLISEFIQCFESKPMRFSGRVVAIQVLVLEKQNNAFEYTLSRKQSKTPAFNIPFAGFILDDGSSSCCCWASAERAATLLRLHECCLVNTYHSSGWRKNRGKHDKTRMTANYHLNRILKKHSGITIKNHRSIFDSSGQDLLFSASSDDVFSSSDENLLKVIITNACSSSVFSIIGSAMDSSATAKLEKDLSDLGMRMDSMQNIWASEVLSVNHLTEARTLIEELVKQ